MPRKLLTRSLLALAAVAVSISVHAQRETIPEAIARGATGRTRSAPSGATPTIAELVRDTDAVVRGIVGVHRSYLSEDKRDIYTEYTIIQPEILYQADVVTTATPGVLPTITIAQLGGTVAVNGVEFTQTELGLRLLQTGTEGLFLLKRVGNRYHIVRTFYGAFAISNGKLVPLTPRDDFAPEYRDAPAAQAAEEMVTRLRTLR